MLIFSILLRTTKWQLFYRHTAKISNKKILVRYIFINQLFWYKKEIQKKIKGIRSLITSGAKIVVNDGAGVSQTSGTGVWEDIIGRLNNIEDMAKFRKQIVEFVPNSGMGKAKFTDPQDP